MHHLHQGMHACIRTPGAQGVDGHPRKPGQRMLQFILYRSTRRLALPAVISQTLVTDTQRQTH